jgi:soluble lytic murein transglycosylase
VRYPISLARGAYWIGRAAAAADDPDLARRWFGTAAEFPTTFYGQLARAALGGTGLFTPPPQPSPTAADRAAIDNHELTAVVRALAESGHTALLRPFVLRLAAIAATPGQRRLVAEVLVAAGRPEFGVVVARRGAREGTALIEFGYPLVDQPGASNHGAPGTMVDDALVLAMLRQESGFDRAAVSRAGALGLMQLMPATAKSVARSLGLPYDKARLTADRDYNLTLGRAFIAGLLDDYDGSYALALAAYYAGPKRVRRWIRLYGDPRRNDIVVIDWIELIPISETRNYVQRVMEAVAIYRYRLGRPAPEHGLLLSITN